MAKDVIQIEVLKDMEFSSGGELRSIKAGEIYSEVDFIALFKNRKAFEFKLKCTSLKYAVKINKIGKVSSNELEQNQEEKEATSEPVEQEKEDLVEPIFLVNEDIKKGKDIVLSKGDKRSFSEIKSVVGNKIESLIKSKSLMEIKVTDNVQI